MGIQAGRAAARAWRRLPRATRRQIRRSARAGYPAPTIELVRTSLLWARAVPTVRRAYGLAWVTAGLVVGGILALAGLRPAASLVIIVLGVVGLLIGAEYGSAIAVGFVNGRALAESDQKPAPGATTVRAASRDWPMALLLGVTVVALGLAFAVDGSESTLFGSSCAGLSVLSMTGSLLLSRRPPAGQPALVLDDGGLRVPHLGLAAPWSQVDAVELGPGSSRNGGLLVRVRLIGGWSDHPAVTGHLNADVLDIRADWLDGDPAAVVAAARAFIAADDASALGS